MNTVILQGILSGQPKAGQSAEGVRFLEMTVVTGGDGRKHRVLVVDEFLAQTIHGQAGDGDSVSVQGELAYDGAGAYVAVPPRRTCDVRVSGATPGLERVQVPEQADDFPGDTPAPAAVSRPVDVGGGQTGAQPDAVADETASDAALDKDDVLVEPDESVKGAVEAEPPVTPASTKPAFGGGFRRAPALPGSSTNTPAAGAEKVKKFGSLGSVSRQQSSEVPDSPGESGDHATRVSQGRPSSFSRPGTPTTRYSSDVSADDIDSQIPF